MTAKIVQLIPSTPEAAIRTRIQREIIVLENRRGLHAPMSARTALIDYAEVLEENAVYLTELDNKNIKPVIDSMVEMAARIRYWLIE